MPKRKTPAPEPDAFERMARELGCDESGEAFERAFAKIVPAKKPGDVAAPRAKAETKKKARRSGPPEREG